MDDADSYGSDFDRNEQPQDYFLEEFGKLKLQYNPYKVGVFSGSGGVTYVVMLAQTELIVFIIQAVFKQKGAQTGLSRQTTLPTNQANTLTEALNQVLDDDDADENEIENFKMARRCTIQLPYGKATLLESYADYFIVGGYEEQPYQIDIYERNKTNALNLKVDVELKRLCRAKSMQQKEIQQLTRMLVPRLRWSDRLCERLESRRRLLSTDQEQSKTYLGLRKLLFIGNCSNPSIGSQKKADTEVFFFLFNAQSKKPDKLKIVAQLKDANQISSINYGPYDNGHLIVGL